MLGDAAIPHLHCEFPRGAKFFAHPPVNLGPMPPHFRERQILPDILPAAMFQNPHHHLHFFVFVIAAQNRPHVLFGEIVIPNEIGALPRALHAFCHAFILN